MEGWVGLATFEKEIAVHAVYMQMWSNCFSSSYKRLSDQLTSEHMAKTVGLRDVVAPVSHRKSRKDTLHSKTA